MLNRPRGAAPIRSRHHSSLNWQPYPDFGLKQHLGLRPSKSCWANFLYSFEPILFGNCDDAGALVG